MTASVSGFSAFLASIKAPGTRTALSPERLASAPELPPQRFATLARVHQSTLGLTPVSPRLQDAMLDIVSALSAADALAGDIDRALVWFRNQPIADFEHFTPMQLLEQEDLQVVVDYIQSISGGAAGWIHPSQPAGSVP